MGWKQRKPKDLHVYQPAKRTAEWLRGLADRIDNDETGTLFKVTVDIRMYHPEPAAKPEAPR